MHPLFAALNTPSGTIELEPRLRAMPMHIAQRYPRLPATPWDVLGHNHCCTRSDAA